MSMAAFIVMAGLLCFNGNNCVDVPYNVTVHVTDNMSLMEKMCWQPVTGCAIFERKEVWIVKSQAGFKQDMSVLFHELLHHEYYAKRKITGEYGELIARDNALRYDLHLMNCYVSNYTVKWNGRSYVDYQNGSCVKVV